MVKLTIVLILTLVLTVFGFAIDLKVDSTAAARIVGGSTAKDGQFPYQISLKVASDGKHYCGGSIINSKWILIAAHCVSNSSPSDWYIFAGNVSITGNGVTHSISRIVIHEYYKTYSLNNDIALLELEEEIEFSTNVQPVELETKDVGEVDCVVSGWGLLVAGGTYPDILQYRNTKTMTSDQCRRSWGSNFAVEKEVCTVATNAEGFCSGDSGGPLVANGKLIGVVSWTGFPCGGGARPDVYTKVSAFVNWIEDNIN